MKNENTHKKTWIVVTNATEAQLYEITEDTAHLIQKLEHPESRLKSIELTADKSGSYQTNHAAHGNFAPADDPHLDQHIQFSREINELLESNRQKNSYQQFILCAEPRFLGLLKKNMKNQVSNLLIRTIEKDYIPLPKHKMDSVIQEIAQSIDTK